MLEKEEEEDEEEEEEEARYTNASIHVRFTKNVPTAKEQNVSNKTFLRNARARANGRMVCICDAASPAGPPPLHRGMVGDANNVNKIPH